LYIIGTGSVEKVARRGKNTNAFIILGREAKST